MNHWNRKEKVSHILALNARITLSVVQTRGDGPPSKWWVMLEGVGHDPQTKQQPKTELAATLDDDQARADALAWALPFVGAFVDEQTDAQRTIVAHLHLGGC